MTGPTASTVPRPALPDESVAAHLQMIQGVIGRMGQNQFNAKTWAITVMAGVFALSPALFSRPFATGIVFIALGLFWAMDAYFLRQEHLFRRLYEAAVRREAPAYSMDTSPYTDAVGATIRFCVSPSVWPVHLITVLAVGTGVLKE